VADIRPPHPARITTSALSTGDITRQIRLLLLLLLRHRDDQNALSILSNVPKLRDRKRRRS